MAIIQGVPDWLFWLIIGTLILILSMTSWKQKRMIVYVVEGLTASAEVIIDAIRRVSFKIILSILILFLFLGFAWGIDNPDVMPLNDRPEIFPLNFGLWLFDVAVSGFQELVLLLFNWVSSLFGTGGA